MTDDGAGPRDRGLWTIPNAISIARLLAVPVFVWLLLAEDRLAAAGVLLAVLGATDWIDGYIARHFDQASEIGGILDPTADRILLFAGVIGLMIQGSLPLWLGVLIFLREAVISLAVLGLAAAGATKVVDVQWAGKAGTLALMFGLPAFLFFDTWGGWFFWACAWGFTLSGLALSYWAAVQYVPQAREALADARAHRGDAG